VTSAGQSPSYVGTELPRFALATNWKGYIGRLLRPYIQGEVLEIGAGLGATAKALVNSSVQRWIAVEPDSQLASNLIGHPIDPAGRIVPQVVVGTIADVAPAARFDTVLYIDVLEHIEDDRAELQRAAGKLRSGGHLIVLSPAFPWAFSAFDRAVGHFRRYTAGSLSAVMPAETERRRVMYADSVGLLLSAGNRFVLGQSTPTTRQVLFWDRIIVPLSRILDPLLGRWWGKSIIAVYRRPMA
jgi:SAM-dependent methyltransferase